MVHRRQLCLTLSPPHQSPCCCLQNASGTDHFFPLPSHCPSPSLQPSCPGRDLPVILRPPCPSTAHTHTAARAIFQEGHESWSLSSCFTLAIPGIESTLLHPGPQAHVTSAPHSALQPYPLSSLNKPSSHCFGLSLAAHLGSPSHSTQGVSHTQRSLPQPWGLLSYHPLLSSWRVPLLRVILCILCCWPIRFKFYNGNTLSYLDHHHTPHPGGWATTWVGGLMDG